MCQVTCAAWASMAAFFATPEYTKRKRDPSDILVSPFRDNLHWSTHSTNGNAHMTPVDMTSAFPANEQLVHVAWAHDYAMEIEPVMRKQRFDAAFRVTPGQATILPSEFDIPVEPRCVPPWTQEGVAGAQVVARVFKESRTE